MTFTRVLFLLLAFLCYLHILRDYYQIKVGYKRWYTKLGHIWHAPKYEVHGMFVLAVLGLYFLYLAFK